MFGQLQLLFGLPPLIQRVYMTTPAAFFFKEAAGVLLCNAPRRGRRVPQAPCKYAHSLLTEKLIDLSCDKF